MWILTPAFQIQTLWVVSTAFKLCQHFMTLCADAIYMHNCSPVGPLHATVWVTNVVVLRLNKCVIMSMKG